MNLLNYLIIFLLSMTPIGERAAIPLAMKVYNIPAWHALFIVSLGAIIPIFFVLYALGPISDFLSKKFKFIDKIMEWLYHHTRKKHSKNIERFEEFALLIFVSIPSPITGPWGGALGAFVFGIPPKKAIPLIFAGVLISGSIIIFLTEGISIFFK